MNRQPSVQDISWFIDLNNINRLDLKPPYQRRSVWTANDRRFFLDTIFRNYPCPPIFIHKTIDESGSATYHVVDGKQRLETILLFSQNKIALSRDFGNDKLDGKKFKDLGPEQKRIFWNYSLPVDFIDLPNDLVINQIFDRVNRNSRNLERQELRHARYDGWFINEAENEADEDPFWENIKITTKAKAKRMKNVQLVSELLLIILEKKIVGFDQDYLDEMYAKYDSLDDLAEFDEDEYMDKKTFVKSFILRMENHNSSITTHAKTASNIHTLFAVVSLDQINDSPENFANKYNTFMELVDELKDVTNIEEKYNDPNNPQPRNAEHALMYARNNRGASTEPPQREARYNALKSGVL